MVVDSPGQNAAMVEKLELPFPLISDPDRSEIIGPFDLADPVDDRNISKPALVLLDENGSELWRFVSRDYADRLPEEEVLERVRSLALDGVTQDAPEPGEPEPGHRAMSVDALIPYFRGARFAALALGLRHGRHDEALKADSKALVAEMDRFHPVMVALAKRKAAR